jgi:hypothetical protein
LRSSERHLHGGLWKDAGRTTAAATLRPRGCSGYLRSLWWEISFEAGLFAAGRYARGRRGTRFFAAAPGLRGPFRSFAHKLHGHQTGDEFFCADAVEINRSTLDIGFSHDSKSVLNMLDALPFGKNLHNCLLVYYRQLRDNS